MCLELRAWGCAFLILGTACCSGPSRTWAGQNGAEAFQRGKHLFERVWEVGDEEAHGDGLGPLFNERSCANCHFQGGIGGAGPHKKNVDLLTPELPKDRDERAMRMRRLISLHAGFRGETNIVLHQYGTNPLYGTFREALVGVFQSQDTDPIRTIKTEGMQLQLSQRNTPGLFGAGLIDAIPEGEIVSIAAVETKENAAVTGRFVGRFGWRGQTRTLSEFVRAACANELGLQVSRHAQAHDAIFHIADGVSQPVDLTEQQCDDLTTFVAQLAAPRRLQPADQQQALLVKEGEQAFGSAGCAICHRAELGNVEGIYSDLLLHDMGSSLSDPVPASRRVRRKSSAGGYSGGSLGGKITLSMQREWRTPPLWGLRDSGPYLHDGRAETIDEAITSHAGEAAFAVERYRKLPRDSRAALTDFLLTLAAPDAGELSRPHIDPRPAKPRKMRLAKN